MIEIIKGEVVGKGDLYLILRTGGIGLKVWTPVSVSSSIAIGEIAQLHTDLILRENDINLYGFLEIKARDLFRSLIKVNGVGPKAALSILSFYSVLSIYEAVHLKDFQQFVRVPGIGNKTAQKIILYLHDKLEPILEKIQFDKNGNYDSELIEALVGLGYSVAEAQASIQSLPQDAPDDFEEKLRLTLKYFSK
ncbi:MAG: Holliday junction branch migration protein RuvA [Anaerolineaceae bacterium]|nr:Holliday junction branch migration protein RuvA [Anaerolineaceae bacterium]